jgi:hypothetical protein
MYRPRSTLVYVPYLDANAKISGDYLMYAKALAIWHYGSILLFLQLPISLSR